MRLRGIMLAGMCAIAAACGAEGRSEPRSAETLAGAPPTLAELAKAWSAGQTRPRCQDRGPRGEYLGTTGDQYCEWDAPAGQVALGTLSGQVDRRGTISLLTWERPTESVADAERVVDSLGVALTARGLVTHQCGEGEVPAGEVLGILWTSPTVEVHLSKITPPTGTPRVFLMAVAAPNSIPAIACPR